MATESHEIVPNRLANAAKDCPPTLDQVPRSQPILCGQVVRGDVSKSTRPRTKPEINQEEEIILKKSAIYCLRTFPMLWTVGGIQEEKGEDGCRRWIIAVYLRYPTGHEGYLGDLLYCNEQLTELTSREVMRERATQIAADPERMRQWIPSAIR